MNLYCVTFYKVYPDKEKTEHKFFVYEKTKQKAVQRFCLSTGYRKTNVLSVHIV